MGKAENKAKLSPAGAGSWAELGNYEVMKVKALLPIMIEIIWLVFQL